MDKTRRALRIGFTRTANRAPDKFPRKLFPNDEGTEGHGLMNAAEALAILRSSDKPAGDNLKHGSIPNTKD
jgi:hypothetical protein